jgi:hypothetical protein
VGIRRQAAGARQASRQLVRWADGPASPAENLACQELSHQRPQTLPLSTLQELGLPIDSSVPLFGFIGRLDQQKGVDLIRDNYEWLMEQGAQLVLLGSGQPALEAALRQARGSRQSCGALWRLQAGCAVLQHYPVVCAATSGDVYIPWVCRAAQLPGLPLSLRQAGWACGINAHS